MLKTNNFNTLRHFCGGFWFKDLNNEKLPVESWILMFKPNVRSSVQQSWTETECICLLSKLVFSQTMMFVWIRTWSIQTKLLLLLHAEHDVCLCFNTQDLFLRLCPSLLVVLLKCAKLAKPEVAAALGGAAKMSPPKSLRRSNFFSWNCCCWCVCARFTTGDWWRGKERLINPRDTFVKTCE